MLPTVPFSRSVSSQTKNIDLRNNHILLFFSPSRKGSTCWANGSFYDHQFCWTAVKMLDSRRFNIGRTDSRWRFHCHLAFGDRAPVQKDSTKYFKLTFQPTHTTNLQLTAWMWNQQAEPQSLLNFRQSPKLLIASVKECQSVCLIRQLLNWRMSLIENTSEVQMIHLKLEFIISLVHWSTIIKI